MPIDAGNTRSLPRTRHSYTLSASSRVYFPHPQFSTSVLQFPAHTSAARQRTPQIHLHPMHYQRLTPTPPPAASKSYISCRRRLQGQFHPGMRTTLADKNPRGLSLAGNMSATSQPVDVAYVVPSPTDAPGVAGKNNISSMAPLPAFLD